MPGLGALTNLTLALRRLRHRPVRSFLLLQGTIWGVAVALFPAAVIRGARETAIERGRQVGADRITFAADPTGVATKPLDPDDVAAIRASVVQAGIPVVAAAGLSARESKAPNGPPWIVHGPPEAPLARGLDLAAGRMLDPGATSLETVVEGLYAQRLAATPDAALGKEVPVDGGRTAKVVGVLAPRSAEMRRTNDQGFDTEHPTFKAITRVLMISLGSPVVVDDWKRTDLCAYVLPTDARVDWIYLRVAPTDLVRAEEVGEKALLDRGKTPVVFRSIVYPLMLSGEIDRFRTVSLALFLACLVMGGVVMANVGLLAALRRAPEIAVHRVEGATRRDVVAQFLVEGAVLAVVGAVLGMGLSTLLATLRVAVEPVAGITWSFPWAEAGTAFGVAVLVGVLASALPAWRAARQDPVAGLVDE
jgi:hypothetical protein